MRKNFKVVLSLMLMISMLMPTISVVKAVEGDTFVAKITVGGKEVDCTYKITKDGENPEAQIGNGKDWETSVDLNVSGELVVPKTVTNSKTGIGYAVTGIGEFAFYNCRALTSTGLEANSSVTSIGFGAFYKCTSLTNTGLERNNTITSIGFDAFYNCTSLTNTGLERNNTITSIGTSAFSGCTSLTSTGLENNQTVTSVEMDAFSFCDNLENVVLPVNSKITSIGYSAFNHCINLESFIIKGNTIPTFNNNAFANVSSEFTLYYPNTITEEKELDKLDNLQYVSIKPYDIESLHVQLQSSLSDNYSANDTFILDGLQFKVSATDKETPLFSYEVDYDKNASLFTYTPIVLKEGNNEIVGKCDGTEFRFNVNAKHTHSYSNDWSSNVINHWKQCSCGDKKEIVEHNYGKWIIDKQPTLLQEGSKSRQCDVCLYKETMKIEKLKSYTFKQGTVYEWKKGRKEELKVIVDCDYSKFDHIEINGKVVDNQHYTSASGSTIITLKPSYLENLDTKKHTLKVVFSDGEANMEFTIKKTDDSETPIIKDNTSKTNTTKSPNTGDTTDTNLYVLLVVIALGVGYIVIKKKYRKE